MGFSKARFAVVLVAVGIGLGAAGYRAVKIRSVAKAEPHRISCADLETNGPGDNAHIILTDFYLCDVAYVYETGRSGWNKVFIPAVPRGSAFHNAVVEALATQQGEELEAELPSEIRVMVKSLSARNEADVDGLAHQSEIQGTIVNVVHDLDAETTNLLGESYPGVDFSNVWILEVGLMPSSVGVVWAWWLGGVVCVLAGAGLYLVGRRSE